MFRLIPQKYIGPVLIVTSHLLFTFSHSLVKYLSAAFPIPQIMIARYIFAPILLTPLFLMKKIKLDLNRPWLLLLRVVAGITAMYLFFTSLKLGDIGKMNLIFQFSVLWTIFLAIILFRERPSRKSVLAVPFAFLGLYLILKPKDLFIFGQAEIYAFAGSFLLAIVLLSIKSLRKDHNSFSIVYIFYTIGTMILLSVTRFTFVKPSLFQTFLLVCTGLLGLSAQLLITKAYRHISASIASSLGLIGIPLMYFSGIFFFTEVVDWQSLLGIIITTSALAIIVKKQ
ncbi:DMT family transporter [Candidatus Margulisiibacteriota bacterium]